MKLTLTSSAFQNEGKIPTQYARKTGNVSPPLAWTGVPEGTRSLALIVDDPDAPSGVFVHWLLYGIPPNVTSLRENQALTPELRNGARQGVNGYGELGYGGPQPPSGTHRYFFHLYAVDTELDYPAGLSRQELDGAIQGHILAEAVLMGKYAQAEKARTA